MATVMIGMGSHATDMVADFIRRNPDLGYIYGNETFRQVAHHADITIRDDETEIYIGINNPQIRAEIAQLLGVKDRAWTHHTVHLGPGCELGHGTHINYGASMTRTRIGAHCTISPGVTICGDVHIGDRVLVGAGAVICDRVTIGDDVTIGAGCVVLPESVVDSGSTIVGVPARHLQTGVHVK